MLVALYHDHHQLPWWGGKTDPFDVFNPVKHKDFPFKGEGILEGEGNNKKLAGYKTISLLEEKYLFSLLYGLHTIDAPHLMAHVSALCKCELKDRGWWHYPKRVWVQISTLPNEFRKDGLPVVYDMTGKRKPELNHVWGGDNGTSFPYSFFFSEELRERAANDSRIWSRFFVEQLDLDPKLKALKENLKAAQSLLAESEEAVRRAQTFGKDCLNFDLNVTFNVC